MSSCGIWADSPPDRSEHRLPELWPKGSMMRLIPASEVATPVSPEPLPRVTWFNHLRPEATTIAMELERRARTGPPPESRLDATWREVFEDVVWSIVNLREFVWVP